MVMAKNGRQIFITGHAEYSRMTLDSEYKRDITRNLPIKVPVNYYQNDDPDLRPILRWRSAADLLFTNWLNYYVYQETPYNLDDIK
jgi:homoserine O-succinyltransferase